LPLQLTSGVRIVGPQAAEFLVSDSNCMAAPVLAPGQSCDAGITFLPAAGSVALRSGAMQVDHDWVGGLAAVALIGSAEASAANAPVSSSSGGGGALGGWLLLGAAAMAAHRLRQKQ